MYSNNTTAESLKSVINRDIRNGLRAIETNSKCESPSTTVLNKHISSLERQLAEKQSIIDKVLGNFRNRPYNSSVPNTNPPKKHYQKKPQR